MDALIAHNATCDETQCKAVRGRSRYSGRDPIVPVAWSTEFPSMVDCVAYTHDRKGVVLKYHTRVDYKRVTDSPVELDAWFDIARVHGVNFARRAALIPSLALAGDSTTVAGRYELVQKDVRVLVARVHHALNAVGAPTRVVHVRVDDPHNFIEVTFDVAEVTELLALAEQEAANA